MKIFILLFIIIYVRRLFNYKIDIDFKPDIIIKPGGRYGYYMCGICHYIKNHFDIRNKKILGFSAGAWSGLLLSIKKENMNLIISDFIQNKSDKINIIMKNTKNTFNRYPLSMYEIENLYIATTNLSKKELSIHHDFLSIEEVTRCCEASSFIPGITYKDMFYFYQNNLSLDGGILFKKFLKQIEKTEKTEKYNPLIISHKMFGRHIHTKIYHNVIKKYDKNHSYYLYIKGYHDAKVNHDYFLQYLKPLNP
jgi:hypothetical protein